MQAEGGPDNRVELQYEEKCHEQAHRRRRVVVSLGHRNAGPSGKGLHRQNKRHLRPVAKTRRPLWRSTAVTDSERRTPNSTEMPFSVSLSITDYTAGPPDCPNRESVHLSAESTHREPASSNRAAPGCDARRPSHRVENNSFEAAPRRHQRLISFFQIPLERDNADNTHHRAGKCVAARSIFCAGPGNHGSKAASTRSSRRSVPLTSDSPRPDPDSH